MKGHPGAQRTLSPEALRGRGCIVPGSIVRQGRSYVLKLYVGRENGKKRDKWITFKTRTEAEAAQRELAAHTLAHSAGVGLYGSPRERLGPYLADWLARQTRLAPKTRRWYDVMAAQVRRDVLGGIPLGRLTPRALEAFYARIVAAGRSSTTALHYHRLLHKALRDAERQDLIMRSPAAEAEAPRRARVRLDVWTEAQTLLFLSEAKTSSPHYPLYLFLAGTGMRIGEALGMTWRDVALNDGALTVAQALQRPKGGGFVLRDPKTRNGVRSIALPEEVLTPLREIRVRQQQERLRRGLCAAGAACRFQHCQAWHALDFVFTQPTGKPLFDNNVRLRDLYPLCRRLGLPWRRALHGFRHAHGSYLLQRKVSLKVIQERLGHATAAFTLSTYAHVLQGMQAQAAQAVSEMLREGKTG